MGSQWPFDCFKLSPTTLLLSGFWQFTTVWFCGNKLTQGLWTGLQVSKPVVVWLLQIVTNSIAIKPTRSDLRVLVIYQCLILWRMNDSRALKKIDNFKFAGIETKIVYIIWVVEPFLPKLNNKAVFLWWSCAKEGLWLSKGSLWVETQASVEQHC